LDALAKLQELYTLRDTTNTQIEQIEAILGSDPAQVKVKRTRGPNKPKEIPANQL
jgi:hypothetical protein